VGDKTAYKPDRKRPVQGSKPRREDNIKTDLSEIWLEGVEWIHLAQDRDQ